MATYVPDGRMDPFGEACGIYCEMTAEQADAYQARAEEVRGRSDYSEAARYYSLAAYENLGECDYPEPEQITTGTFIGLALYCLEQAAVSSHIAGNERRCRNRANQGIQIAADIRDDVFTDSALIGLANEWIGDFRNIAEIEGAESAYATALSEYESVDDPFGWSHETIFEWGIETFLEMSAAAGRPVSLDTQEAMHSSFEARLDQKQKHFEENLSKVYDEGAFSNTELTDRCEASQRNTYSSVRTRSKSFEQVRVFLGFLEGIEIGVPTDE